MNKKTLLITSSIFAILYMMINYCAYEYEYNFYYNSVYITKRGSYILSILSPIIIILFYILYIKAINNKEKYFDIKKLTKTISLCNFSYFFLVMIDILYTLLFTRYITHIYGNYDLLMKIFHSICHFTVKANIWYLLIYILFIIWILTSKKKKIKRSKNNNQVI